VDRPFRTAHQRDALQSRLRRSAAISGILFATTFAAHIVLAITVGHSADRPDNLANVFAANALAARAIFILLFVSVALFVPFLWGLTSFTEADDQRTDALPVFAFGACAACLVLLALFIGGEAALAGKSAASPRLGLAILTTKESFETVADVVLATLALAGGLMLRRTHQLPRRLGWLGIAGGGAYGVGVLSDINPHINSRPAEMAGVALVIVWIVLTSVFMLRRATP
jgi:hypothetical protein